MNALRTKKVKAAKDSPKTERAFSHASKTLFLKPRLSEKTYGLSENLNVYTFEVPAGSTKLTIADAIVAQYGKVTIKSVRVAAVPGKTQRTYRRRSHSSASGKRSGIRKAYVTLKAGDKLPIYAAVEESSKAANPSTSAQGKGGK